MSEVTLTPRTRVGLFARITNSVVSLAVVAGVFVGLGFAVGPGVAIFGFVLAALTMLYAVRRGLKLRLLRRTDPAAVDRIVDRSATRIGKFYAGLAFATMGIGVIAIIAVLVTHT
jgi:hypothetical protein